MEIQIERKPLLKALSRIQTVVGRSNTMPILSNALIESQEDRIIISSTNMTVSLQTTCPAVFVDPGSFTVNAKTLYEVVRELSEETIVLRKDKSDRLLLSCGRAKFKLAGFPCEQFPSIPQADGVYRFSMDSRVLADMFTKTHFAVSREENRPTLNGLFFQVTPATEEGEAGAIRVVATDTHRLAMVECFLPYLPAEPLGVIIPRNAVQEIRRMLETEQQPLEIILDRNYIQLVGHDVNLVSKLVEGRFPDCRRVIPMDNPLHMNVNREQLLEVVKRMSVTSNEKSRGVRLTIDHEQMQFNSNNSEQELAEEKMQVSLEGGTALTVGFNARYLKEFLAVMDGTEVRFSMKYTESPILLVDPNQPGTKFVLMPMIV